jgi:hypothetical protein
MTYRHVRYIVRRSILLATAMTLPVGSGVYAAEPAAAPAFDPAALRAAMDAFNKKPDTPGTGKYPALKEEVASLPDHVIYRPKDLSALGAQKLGVLAWGNGGCAADGAGGRFHLSEIASHGYLAIASGRILSGPGAPPQATPLPPPPARGGDGMPRTLPAPATKAEDLRAAIDWALAENVRQGSAYYGRIDPRWIAVSGWSCGGLQALQIAADPRVRAVVIHNSGIFNAGANRQPGMDVGKETLKKLHTPVIYILGGPTDIAYSNGMDDFKRIDHVPAVAANLDVGHGGTFIEANGGRAAVVAVKWLDWQLKGDREAANFFSGTACGLCKDAAWKLERKGLE